MPRKKREIDARLRMGLILGGVVGLAILIGLLFTPIFYVQDVWCEGNSRISQEEILAAAQVEQEKNILLQNLSEIKTRVEEIPMVEEAGVRRVFPNRVKIWIRECIPGAYIQEEGKCTVVDVEGKVLEIIEDGRVEKMITAYTPIHLPAYKPESEKKETAPSGQPSQSPAPSATSTPTPEATVSATPTATASVGLDNLEEKKEVGEVTENLRPYEAPLVMGLTLDHPKVGKRAESKNETLLKTALETFRALEKVGLLSRATYMDLRNLNEVTLVIENRLEIQLGDLENMEYRSAFLAKVINEKMSETEHAIMDYRTEDVYVRQPEDGKARIVPRPSPTPSPSPSPSPSPVPTTAGGMEDEMIGEPPRTSEQSIQL